MEMPSLLVNDDAVWLKTISADPNLLSLLGQLPQGTPIFIEICGEELKFEKMRDGKDGRPTLGLKPVGSSRDIWKTFRDTRRGEKLPFRIIERKSNYLGSIQTTLTEWDSDADEVAFRDL